MRLTAPFSLLAANLLLLSSTVSAVPAPDNSNHLPSYAGRSIFPLLPPTGSADDMLAKRYTIENDNSYPRKYDGPYLADNPGPWKEAFEKAKALVDQMTVEEKANITVGYT
jgi:hypothetical protein